MGAKPNPESTSFYNRTSIIKGCRLTYKSRKYVHIAQLAEHLTFNQKVGVSSTPVDTKGLPLPNRQDITELLSFKKHISHSFLYHIPCILSVLCGELMPKHTYECTLILVPVEFTTPPPFHIIHNKYSVLSKK